MSLAPVPGSVSQINSVLEQLFRAHGIETERHGDLIHFPHHPRFAIDGEAFDMGTPAGQLDVRLRLPDGRVLCESVSGIASDLDGRINNGLLVFSQTSFHVLISAFFGAAEGDHVAREAWEIGGHARGVFLGNATTRFGFPPGLNGQPDMSFFPVFQQAIQSQPLPPGTHWVRLYHIEHDGECLANEVLLDNADWPAVRWPMDRFDWPRVGGGTYDVRLFLVVCDRTELPG
ncbi:MAG: hypothetical protein K2V38_02670 [Gemmataceae bacterium]|nr:hypothetical protein [Gemmataceae bacterium]